MTVSTNRSPSPLPPSRQNFHPRTSVAEVNSAARRSFSGSPSPKPFALTNSRRILTPITPANSPADSARRAKEDIPSPWDSAEKENEKAAKIRSPAKGSKNFMSPTISAASKFCPSPKKKVLVERNEPVRTSITLCDGKATFFSSISSDSAENSKPKSEIRSDKSNIHGAQVSKTTKKVTFAEVKHCENAPDSVVIGSDFFNTENSSKNMNSCSNLSPSTNIAPLDADPSQSPYDPKTNYLSPRPQFLHYRPNPRIEVLKIMDEGIEIMGEPRQLDESFMSEIVSESSDSESQKESEDSSSIEAETVVELEAEVETKEKETKLVEELSLPVSTHAADEMAKEIPNVQKLTKRRFFSGSKLAYMVLVLVIAGVSFSVTDSPIVNGYYGVKDLKLTDLSHLRSQISVLIKSTWILDSSNVINGELGPVQFINLTDLKGGSKWELENTRELIKMEEQREEDELDNDAESEKLVEEDAEGDDPHIDDDSVETEIGGELEFEDEVEVEVEVEENELESEVVVEEDVGTAETEASEEVHTNSGDKSEITSEGNLVLEVDVVKVNDYDTFDVNPSVDDSQAFDIKVEDKAIDVQPEVVEAVKFQGNEMDARIESKVDDSSDEKPSNSETLESPAHIQEDESFTTRNMLGISSVFLGVLAVAAFIILKQKNAIPDYIALADPCLHKSAKHKGEEKQYSQNWPTEFDVVAESCPSEMSTSYSRKEEEMQTSRAQKKHDRKPSKSSSRRESVAASSDYSQDSPSYGSFTTYEKIPIKHGDEVMTPVRRSNRIRSQVTSP